IRIPARRHRTIAAPAVIVRALLLPGVALMICLRFAPKLLLILVLVVIPLIAFTVFYLFDLSRQLETVEQELRGAAFIQPVADFMCVVQQHRDAVDRSTRGDATSFLRLSADRTAAERAEAELDALVDQHRDRLPAVTAWHDIKASWNALAAAGGTLSAAEAFDAHSLLIQRLLVFLTQVADESGLTLDPELDAYFLMVAATETFPQVTEYMARQRTIGTAVAARGATTEEDRIRLYSSMDSVAAALQRTEAGMTRLFQYDDFLRGRLQRPAGNALAVVEELQQAFLENILEAPVITVSSEQVFQRSSRAIDAVFAMHRAVTGHLVDRLTARRDEMALFRRVLTPAAVAGFLMTIYLVTSFSVSSVSRLRTLEAAALRLAEGDLRESGLQVQGRDESARCMQAVTDTARTLRELIDGVVASADAVHASAAQLVAAADQSAAAAENATEVVGALAADASKQAQAADTGFAAAARLQENVQQIEARARQTSAEVDGAAALAGQMTAASQAMAERAAALAAETERASAKARDGAQVIRSTVSSMGNIREVIQDTAAGVRELHRLSAKIGEITELIADITDQTNLLALNAAIEAARAGQHGRGFAVVADEVRTLASRSAESAGEIGRVIQEIQRRVEQAATAMERATEQVDGGVAMAAEAGEALQAILAAIEQTAQGVADIAAAAQQVQADGQRVAGALAAIARAAEENAAATAEMARGAAEMAGAAQLTAATAENNASGAEEV